MERLNQLEHDREERRGQAKEILDAAAKDKRVLSEEEEQQLEQLSSDLEKIEATIKHERKRLDWDRTSADVVNTPDGDAAPRKKGALRASMGGPNPWGDTSTEIGAQTAFGEMLQAVHRYATGGGLDPRLNQGPQAAASGLSTGVGSDSGFLVRTDFSTRLLDRAMTAAVLAPRCSMIPLGDNADGIELPYVDETSRATGSRWGGVRVYRRSEAATVTAAKPKFGYLEIRLEDLMGLCYATNRALRDATSLGEIISRAFAEEFAFTVDDEIIRGTGAGQALGILSSGATVSQAKETSQVAATIVAENAMKMRVRMPARQWMDAAWYVNQDALPQLWQMNIKVKNVAGSENVGGFGVYQPANGLAGQQYDTLFGRPVIPIEQAETLGTVGDFMYLNLNEYLLISKGGLETAESIHVRFLYGENTFRFTYSINGAPAWKSALTPYKGSNTQSPFVTLATRS